MDLDFLHEGLFIEEFDDNASDDALEPSTVPELLPDMPYLMRTSAYWQQIPLPGGVCGADTNVLASLDDDVLLTMSASLIVHVQRTEASGGLQVISPRQVTLGGVAARTAEDRRTTDMFLAGSAANRNMDWPVSEGPVPDHLFWREPIDSYPSEPAARGRTVSSGVLSSTQGISDPITKAFLIGRALVDLQRRIDVGGTAEELATVLACAWGLSSEVYTSMGEASLAPVGDLLRYAIRSDVVYPVVNAPIQARRALSVGANTAGRLLYGEYSAIDWRRMRVLAESVFYQTSRLEGHTLAEMVSPLPPGNPKAPPVRPGILQMRPLPGSVWTFDPITFRLEVAAGSVIGVAAQLPDRVALAVEAYHRDAKVLVSAIDHGVEVSATSSTKYTPATDTGEALIAGFRTLITMNSTFSARGRTSAAAVRGFVYDCLATNTQLSALRALWLIRYLNDTARAMGIAHLLDHQTACQVAARMPDLTADLRVRLAVEAGRRGADLDSWWHDLASVLPPQIRAMSEGSGSWALAVAHMLIHPVTDKWVKLAGAMSYASHVSMASASLSGVRLPAKIGSSERTFEACRAVARRLGHSYSAYYGAMYDVTCVLGDRMKRAGNRLGAERLLLAGGMWRIRARAAGTVDLHCDASVSKAGGEVAHAHGVFRMTTAPYSAYLLWLTAVNSSVGVAKDAKAQFPGRVPHLVSECFIGAARPLFKPSQGGAARVYRYSNNPSMLSLEIERTLEMIRADISLVAARYDTEEQDMEYTLEVSSEPPQSTLVVDTSAFVPAANTYWDLLGRMDPAVASEIVDALARLDDAMSAELESRTFADADELISQAWAAVDGDTTARARARDTVT